MESLGREDVLLILGLLEERERLRVERDGLQRQLETVSRQLRNLTLPAIAEKMEVSRGTVDNLARGLTHKELVQAYREGKVQEAD